MVIGNFAALLQTNVKRLLGYSSIAHAGYVLVAFTAHSQIGIAAAMFYLASYALMNIGAFAVVSHVASRNEKYVKIDDLSGLGRREPATAALLAVFVFSLIGVPLTGGFFAKFYIFQAALDSHLVWLTILGLINSAIAAYYYLKIIVAIYMREPGAGYYGPRATVGGRACGHLGKRARYAIPRNFPLSLAVVRLYFCRGIAIGSLDFLHSEVVF